MNKKNQVKIFIISTFYNTSEKDFLRGVQSINDQKYKNFEWIIINDGSNNKINYGEILKENNFFLYFNFQENVGINKRADFGITKVLKKRERKEGLILFFDLDDEIDQLALDKINAIYQKIDFDILFFYKIDYILNKLDEKEINHLDVDDIWENKIDAKDNWYNLNNEKSNYFLLFKLASIASPRDKIYSTKMLFQMNEDLKLNNNFFYHEKIYKNFDFKLSYLSVFYSDNIVLVNDKYYKYYVGSESSVTKNDKKFQTHSVYSYLIKFLKSNIETWPNNNNNKVIWISFLLLYAIIGDDIKIIDLIKLKKYLIFLIEKINKDEEFKKMLPLKKIKIGFMIIVFLKRIFKKIKNLLYLCKILLCFIYSKIKNIFHKFCQFTRKK